MRNDLVDAHKGEMGPETLPAYEPHPTLAISAKASAKHRRLHSVILATQHVEPTLVEVNAEIDVLREKHKRAQQNLTHTTATADREKEEWVKAKESRFDKLFHRREYNATVKKEGDEYEAAHDWQLRAEAAEKVLSSQLDELTTRRNALWKEEVQRKNAKRELLMLYDDIFEGPTTKYPEEDRMEADCAALQKIVQDFDKRIWHLLKTSELVSNAKSSILTARDVIASSTSYTLETSAGAALQVMIGIADIMVPRPYYTTSVVQHKQRTIDNTGGVTGRVRNLLAQADECISTARQLDPAVLVDVVPVHQLDPAVLVDVVPVHQIGESNGLDSASKFFNAPLTDIICHRELKDAKEAVSLLEGLLVEEDRKCKDRVEAARREKVPVEEQLVLANDELFEMRSRLFDEELGKRKAESAEKLG